MTEPTTWGDILKPIVKQIKHSVKRLNPFELFKHKDPEPTLTRHERAYEEFMSNRTEPIRPNRVYVPSPSELLEIDENMVVTDRRRGRPPVFNTPRTKGVLYICMEAATQEYLEMLHNKGYEVRDIKEMRR